MDNKNKFENTGGSNMEEINEAEKSIINELEGFVQEKLKDIPAHHGWEHVNRVREYAKEICKEEGGDMLSVEIAALCHDLGRVIEKTDPRKRRHAILSLNEAHGFLQDLYQRGMIDIDRWRGISSAIARHSKLPKEGGKSELTQKELTQKIIRDADRLDGFGFSGILRSLEDSRDNKSPFYEDGETILYGEDVLVPLNQKTAIGDINAVYDWRKLLELDGTKKSALPKLKIMREFLELFSHHQEKRDYDFWINFLKYCQKGNCDSLSEKIFKDYLSSLEK